MTDRESTAPSADFIRYSAPAMPYGEEPRDEVVAWDREETEPCQAGTVGCCIDHALTQAPCHTW